MILENDDMIIWRDRTHMILKGNVIDGDLMLTTKKLFFMHVDGRALFKKDRNERVIWDLDIGKIKDIRIHEVEGQKAPYVRILYNEKEAFFTFPGKDLEQMVAALILLVNHGRTISRMRANANNIKNTLDDGNLYLGEEMPKLVRDLPSKVDEECFQCGKPLIDEELVQDINECLTCLPEE